MSTKETLEPYFPRTIFAFEDCLMPFQTVHFLNAQIFKPFWDIFISLDISGKVFKIKRVELLQYISISS